MMDLINLFYSNDLYLINKRVEDFLVSNKIKTEDVIYCDDEKMDLIEMINEWNTISFFNEMRCFWIKNPLFLSQNSSLKDEEIKQLSKYLKDPMDTTILIFSTDHLVETSEAFIQLKKYAYLEELTNTDQDSMFNYTKDYFRDTN